MLRSLLWFPGLAALVVLGCARPHANQPVPFAGPVMQHQAGFDAEVHLPNDLDWPAASTVPVEHEPFVYDSPLMSRRPGGMTMDDAIQLAMRNSAIVRVASGGEVTASTATRYDVLVSETRIQAALAAFDTSLESEFFATRIKQPPNAFFGPGLAEPTLRDESTFNAALTKRWFSGAQSSVAFNPRPGYLYLPPSTSSGFNPTYVGNLEFSVSQPVLRGAGQRVNRAPIQIRQIESEQSAWEFKKAVMASARSVIEEYWNLYAAHVALESIDQVIPLLEEVVHLQEENYKAEWVIYADVAKALTQLHDFRQQRIQAHSQVVERELRLRHLLGLPPADGWALQPTSTPHDTPVVIDAQDAFTTAALNQPDLVRQQLDLRIRELELVVARNSRLPNLDFRALYRMNGVGENLGDTLSQLASAEYSDWLVGMTFSVPLGRRLGTANTQAAELQLSRTHGLLNQTFLRFRHRIGDNLRQIDFTRLQYDQAVLQSRAANDWMHGARLRYQNPHAGGADGQNWLLQTLNEYLFALRFRTESVSNAAALLAEYNSALVRLEETKGTLLAMLDIDVVHDPCCQAQLFASPDQSPDTAIPASQLPASQLPASQLPASQLPASQLPASQLPASQLPASQLPAPQPPAMQFPASQSQPPSAAQPIVPATIPIAVPYASIVPRSALPHAWYDVSPGNGVRPLMTPATPAFDRATSPRAALPQTVPWPNVPLPPATPFPATPFPATPFPADAFRLSVLGSTGTLPRLAPTSSMSFGSSLSRLPAMSVSPGIRAAAPNNAARFQSPTTLAPTR